MGRFVMELVIGLIIGTVFSEDIFPNGFSAAVEQWGAQIRSEIPGRS